MRAIIMAGGLGTRMQGVLKDIPKAMAPIAGMPLIAHQIECLKRNGVREITVVIGHLGDAIKDYLGNGLELGVDVSYFEETTPLGTAGALFYLKNFITEPTALVFGDIFFDIDLKRFMRFHTEKNADITLFVHPNSHPFDSDLVSLAEDKRVKGWDSKNNVRDYDYYNCVNSGLYIISPAVHDVITDGTKRDLDKTVVREFIEKGTVFGYESSEYVKDAGTPDRYQHVENDYLNGVTKARCLENKQRCVFLDRDGTINKYNGFITDKNAIELVNGAAEAVRLINNSEFICIVVTNQPVIARGECTHENLAEIHKRLYTELGKGGAYVDGLYYCPHHPHKGYAGEVAELKIDCDCRKPKTGMFKDAASDFNIDLDRSAMIGDSDADIAAGKALNLKTVRILGTSEKNEIKADFECDNLIDAVKFVLKN